MVMARAWPRAWDRAGPDVVEGVLVAEVSRVVAEVERDVVCREVENAQATLRDRLGQQPERLARRRLPQPTTVAVTSERARD